jgi:peptidoglycan hydrolase CwlO-like protein
LSISRGRKLLSIAILAALLITPAIVPLARAASPGISSINGPYDIVWSAAIWNNRYVGNTLLIEFGLVNLDTGPPDTLSSVTLYTPWGTFTDSSLPASFCGQCVYYYDVNVTIPTTQQPGYTNWSINFTGKYNSGSPYCTDTNDICSYSFSLYISADPDQLASEVSALTTQVNNLNSEVTSLTTELNSANNNIATLQSQITSFQTQVSQLNTQITSLTSKLTAANSSIASYKTQVSGLNGQISALNGQVTTITGQLSTAKNNASSLATTLNSANAQLQSAKATLSSVQGQLSSTQSQLTSTQSQVDTYNRLYLPLGILIPTAIAAMLAGFLIRKRRAPAPHAPQMPQAPP